MKQRVYHAKRSPRILGEQDAAVGSISACSKPDATMMNLTLQYNSIGGDADAIGERRRAMGNPTRVRSHRP